MEPLSDSGEASEDPGLGLGDLPDFRLFGSSLADRFSRRVLTGGARRTKPGSGVDSFFGSDVEEGSAGRGLDFAGKGFWADSGRGEGERHGDGDGRLGV